MLFNLGYQLREKINELEYANQRKAFFSLYLNLNGKSIGIYYRSLKGNSWGDPSLTVVLVYKSKFNDFLKI